MDADLKRGCSPEEALKALISQYHTPLLRMCCVILRDMSAAEDAVQETFLKAYRNWSHFEGQCSAKTWLTTIAVNTCRDMRRSAWFRHTERRVTPEELPIPAPGADEDAYALGQAIANLPEKYRDAVLLYYYQDMTMQETAAILKTTPSNIAKRLARARALLRKEMEASLS